MQHQEQARFVKTPYPSAMNLAQEAGIRSLQNQKQPQLRTSNPAQVTQGLQDEQNAPKNNHKQLIISLQEEVNFLAKQNSQLKAALVISQESTGFPKFDHFKIKEKFQKYADKKISSIKSGHKAVLENHETRVVKLQLGVLTLKESFVRRTAKAKEWKTQKIAEISNLQSKVQSSDAQIKLLTADRSQLATEVKNLSLVISQKDSQTQNLIQEVQRLAQNQIDDAKKQGELFVIPEKINHAEVEHLRVKLEEGHKVIHD